MIPTLLTWPESAVIHDPKGEAWAITSGWRHTWGNNLVFRFDPSSMDGNSCGFNPLSEVRLSLPAEVGDAQNIARMLIDSDGIGLLDHWSKTAQSLLTAAILHCLYKDDAASLFDVGCLLSSPEADIETILNEMLDYPHRSEEGAHPMIKAEARAMLNRDFKRKL